MIKQFTINRIKFILGLLLAVLISRVLEVNLAVVLFLLCLILYLESAHKNLRLKNYNLLYLTFLFTLLFVISYLVIREGLSPFYIPFSASVMLATILFDELMLSLSFTLAASTVIAALAGNNFFVGLLFLISGILSGTLVRGVRRRGVVIRAGFIIGLVQALALFFIYRFRLDNLRPHILLIGNGIFSSIIAVGVLPIFEYLFKSVTNISLLELADFNHPLLQRMVMEAPGTYHHSLIVGNLSDAASTAIGAQALLARIGAYYHDIGKLSKPEYFSENQSLAANKHDELSPTMSKMVIMHHVREGLDLAKKYKLNSRLIDFIQQHHGSSLVYYFYRRALETLEDDQEIKEEGFRYPGPKPKTKETAIVLLADSVEAAARALKDPAPTNIKEVVHKIINNKFIDGQLDDCDLTLKDLEKIAEVFIRILSGIYHSRITYPESSKDLSRENNRK